MTWRLIFNSYYCDNTLLDDAPTIPTNQTTHDHQNRRVVFLISGQWYFTFRYQHTKYTTERVEEKEETATGLGLLQAQEGTSRWHFPCNLCFCGLMSACTWAKLPQATGNADLNSHIGQPGICRSTGFSNCLSDFCWLVSSLPDSFLDLFSRLVSAAPFCWLWCSVLSWTFLPSSTFDLVGDLMHKPFVWVLRRNRDLLTATHSHRNECHPSYHTTSRCRGGHYSFPWIAPLCLYNAEC